MGSNACNGWAFWSLDTGEGLAATGPVRSARATPRGKSSVTPAPKSAEFTGRNEGDLGLYAGTDQVSA